MMGSVRTFAAAARVQASAGGGAMPAGGKAVLTNKALRVFPVDLSGPDGAPAGFPLYL